MTDGQKNTAIILAAGKGSRMGSRTPKQFMFFYGEPMVLRSLRVFNDSPAIDEIILVTDGDYIEYCRSLIDKKQIGKVTAVVPGGRERYESVLRGLEACDKEACRFVFIHDSARPYLTWDIIERAYEAVKEHPACAVGVPAKDTIKIVDPEGFVTETPVRDRTWIIQTPQVFSYELLCRAYERVGESAEGFEGITDDAMIVERSGLARVRLVRGSYANIKITTPEDLPVGACKEGVRLL